MRVRLGCVLGGSVLMGGEMTQVGACYLGLLTNDDGLDVEQDPLGRQAARVAKEDTAEVWAKDLEDGSMAVGLFNRSGDETVVTAKWADLGLTGKQTARDLWRQQDLGQFEGDFHASVPRHVGVLVQLR